MLRLENIQNRRSHIPPRIRNLIPDLKDTDNYRNAGYTVQKRHVTEWETI